MRSQRIFLIALLSSPGWGLGCFEARGANQDQPVRFSHRTHVDNGADCAFCHGQSAKQHAAGTPFVEDCMTCHKTMDSGGADVQKLFEFAESNQPIPWVRQQRLPSYVFFTHKWHIRAGLECQQCHGEIGEFDGMAPYREFQMAECMDCHTQERASNDCMTCHL